MLVSAVCVTCCSVAPAPMVTSAATISPASVPVPEPETLSLKSDGHRGVVVGRGDRLDGRRGAGGVRPHPGTDEAEPDERGRDQNDARSQPHVEFPPAWPVSGRQQQCEGTITCHALRVKHLDANHREVRKPTASGCAGSATRPFGRTRRATNLATFVAVATSTGGWADSGGGRDKLVESFGWSIPSEGLAGASVEEDGDVVEFFLGVDGEVGAFGEELADEAVPVLVGAALPG